MQKIQSLFLIRVQRPAANMWAVQKGMSPEQGLLHQPLFEETSLK